MILLSALTDTVSSNDIDISFDGVDLLDGLKQLGDYFQNLPNKLPGYERVGSFFGAMLKAFPPRFWFALIVCIICMCIGRILRRY